MKHRPETVSNFINTLIRENTALKYSMHSWDNHKWENVDLFREELFTAWENMDKKSLKTYSNKLYKKIELFLFEADFSNGLNWGKNFVPFGWGSDHLSGLSNPYSLVLPDQYRMRVNGCSIDRFSDIVELFKDEIEIRSEKNALKKLLVENIKKYFGFDFKTCFKNLDNPSIYIDVESFSSALDYTFMGISQAKEYNSIRFESTTVNNAHIFKIIQMDRTIDNIALLAFLDSSNQLRDTLLSVCDISIEAKFKEGSYNIDLFSRHKTRVKNIDGLTYIFKLYK